jgi:hypothetical protein
MCFKIVLNIRLSSSAALSRSQMLDFASDIADDVSACSTFDYNNNNNNNNNMLTLVIFALETGCGCGERAHHWHTRLFSAGNDSTTTTLVRR